VRNRSAHVRRWREADARSHVLVEQAAATPIDARGPLERRRMCRTHMNESMFDAPTDNRSGYHACASEVRAVTASSKKNQQKKLNQNKNTRKKYNDKNTKIKSNRNTTRKKKEK